MSLLAVVVILSVIWGEERVRGIVYLGEERICKTSRKKSCFKGERNNVICKYAFWWEFPVFYLRKNFRLTSKTNKGAQNEGMKTESELEKQWQQFSLSASRWWAQESRSMHIKKEGKNLASASLRGWERKEEKGKKQGGGWEQTVNQEEIGGKKWILKSKEEMTIPKASARSNQFAGSI